MKEHISHSFSKITLDLSSAELEDQFQKDTIESSMGTMRLALFSGAIFYALFGVSDYLLYPDIFTTFISLRFGIGFPALLIALLAPLIKDYWKYAGAINLSIVTILAYTIVFMSFIGIDHPEINRISAGFPLTFLYMHVFLHLRFKNTLVAGTSVLIFQSIAETLFTHSTPAIAATNITYISSAHFIGVIAAYIIECRAKSEFLMRLKLEEISNHDILTGLKNRYFFNTVTNRLLKRFLRQAADPEKRREIDRNSAGYGLIIIDIDHFKTINDRFGHPEGDKVLKRFSRILVDSTRWDDVIVRWGGEEFIIVTQNVDHSTLVKFVRNLGKTISETKIKVKNTTINLNCSMGAITLPFKNETNIDILIHYADSALYTSKEQGRNNGHIAKIDEKGKVRFQNIEYVT